ncbi:hypothetical protein PMG71_17295 [Roseofilum sp. BLCC_M154]|uniref:Uncharacterized protein n=1 Tax=Roseofilum acuticapitatum BLCC-M154 TaxID=3022444 RepID=A0ABT7AY09_9CYAN|nr:hypothetical protein [Roseofilum acuticapitatum]MDJ1171186.1 hypothetical protein [Roseofilum acuticapitatum BLCC-M154]
MTFKPGTLVSEKPGFLKKPGFWLPAIAPGVGAGLQYSALRCIGGQ